MHVFLETERLILRRFTTDDVDNLVELDSDPDVMLHITGGRTTTREEIENEILPAFLGYYERFDGYGFWAVVEKSTGDFLGWFHFRPGEGHADDEPELGLPAAEVGLGQGLRDRGVDRVDPQRVHRVRRAPGGGRDDGRAHRLAAGHGEGRYARRPDVPPGLARSDPRRRARRRRVRDHRDEWEEWMQQQASGHPPRRPE